MRTSEPIGCQVYDAEDQAVGTVHDLHFRLRAGSGGSQVCQLDALECGGIGLGHRLGYGEHAMRGPWPFPQLFRYLARHSLAVALVRGHRGRGPPDQHLHAPRPAPARPEIPEMTQTGGLVILYAWLIFAGLLAGLAYLLLRHEQDPLQDLSRPGPDEDGHHDQAESLPLHRRSVTG